MTTSEAAIQSGGSDYTPASGRALIIQGLWIYNANAAAKYGNVKVGTTLLSGDEQIPSKGTLLMTDLNLPLLAAEKIYVKGEVATDLKYRLWGVEIDA
ncbi:MAG TPA: hypothetical protein PLC08_06290 [Candidatus Bipolaricaulis sp.]|nr:hypothetical protein [Candidatus Bipolaricaulis sp.]